jgi:hypothetical protein
MNGPDWKEVILIGGPWDGTEHCLPADQEELEILNFMLRSRELTLEAYKRALRKDKTTGEEDLNEINSVIKAVAGERREEPEMSRTASLYLRKPGTNEYHFVRIIPPDEYEVRRLARGE